jgi:hypothetical protein
LAPTFQTTLRHKPECVSTDNFINKLKLSTTTTTTNNNNNNNNNNDAAAAVATAGGNTSEFCAAIN